MNVPRQFRDRKRGSGTMKRSVVLDLSIVGLAALALCAPALAQTAPQSAAPSTAIRQQAWDVKGLEGPAEIVVDHWGIPHIFAASQRDAYFLQGYNAARDRLWQI